MNDLICTKKKKKKKKKREKETKKKTKLDIDFNFYTVKRTVKDSVQFAEEFHNSVMQFLREKSRWKLAFKNSPVNIPNHTVA